ncbi:MAG: hypothetical protein AB7O21_16245 [Gammaproteobacteria bacterium]
MNIYAVDKLMAEARRLAAEYRRVTGKTLPLSGEIAVSDAARLLGLAVATAPDAGFDASRGEGDQCERFLIKARVVFDEQKGAHRLGELKLERPWDTLLVVLMNADYETVEIYAVPRDGVAAALADGAAGRKGTLSVPRVKIIGRRVWPADAAGPETRAVDA